MIVPPEVICEIGRIMEKRGIWCLSDEIYYKLIFGDAVHKSVASVSDYCRDHTVVVNGCSKTYAMTGWRMGWIGACEEVAKAVDSLQGQTTSNPAAATQAAAVAALNGPQDCVEEMRQQFDARRHVIHGLLNEIPGVSCTMPNGAFYALPNVSGLFGRTLAGKLIRNPTDFCKVALDESFVAMVPGEPFGAPDHVRLSYATDMQSIEEGCRLLKMLVESGT
jgi:aspartate aminotransferase